MINRGILTRIVQKQSLASDTSIMPKSKGQKPKNEENREKPVASGPVTLDKSGNISIKIWCKPGAKADNITDVGSEAVSVQISAPPVEGEANASLIKYLASVFSLRKSDVSLERGSKSRQKTVLLQANAISVEQVIEKLKNAMDKS